MSERKKSVTESEMQSFVDGQLDASQAEHIEQYLQDNPDEAARISSYQLQNNLLNKLYAAEDLPLLNRLRANFDRSIRTRTRVSLSLVAGVTWLLIGMGLGWSLHTTTQTVVSEVANLPRAAVAAHAVYTPEVRHPVEVTADQEAHLVKWLSKRLDQKIRVPDLSSLGYSLVGGRLLPADTGPAAQFMYEESSGERLTLYVIAQAKNDKDTAFRYFERNNIKVFYWTDAKMGFAIAGGIDKVMLLKAANQIYQDLSI